MGALHASIRRDTYQDSVCLMVLTARLQDLAGVERAAAMMGTPANKALLGEAGLLAPAFEAAGVGDLCIAVLGETEAAERAVAEVGRFLKSQAVPSSAGYEAAPRSLHGALQQLPDANLAMISVPGAFAAEEAMRALERGLHVFLFSDNVPFAEEVAVKHEAERRGLLLMGADCGTAIVNGTVLGFGNAVPRGPVGIVGSSGTGIQEVSCLLARAGVGVSQALGTGSHDLAEEIGGSTTCLALAALLEDPNTHAIVWVAKPGDPGPTERVLALCQASPKPVVAALLGIADRTAYVERYPNVYVAASLKAAAFTAARRMGGAAPDTGDHSTPFNPVLGRMLPEQVALRGIFAGGTLAQEAAGILAPAAGEPLPERPAGTLLAAGPHTIVDYGDDAYTRGRAHPMLDPRLRQEAIRAAGNDPTVAIVLLDIVLGYGGLDDPVGALLPAMVDARNTARARGGDLLVLVALVGTEGDPRPYSAQRRLLERAGMIVARGNAQAATWAARGLAARSGARV